ncbi:MAG: hypothetical protein HeimC2_29400 [Candidatus Heimdallarchaeota archaeon LC_2]|nr:MAG: hypothetical protein HeimC2_29400 [Candidatus Heimdallarchaeota archaeon LC_2]
MMSLLVHPRHSVQLLQYVTRRFNGIIGFNLIKVKTNSVKINFPLHQNSNESVMAILFTKLATSFKIINVRYLGKNEKHRHVQVKFNQDEDFFQIKISGSLYVPTSKFLKLYNLILWYYIRYITGQKPSMSEKGRTLSELWKSEGKQIIKEINALPRKMNVSYNSHPCNICGESTLRSNLWKFKSKRLSSGIEIETFVCEKHLDKLI